MNWLRVYIYICPKHKILNNISKSNKDVSDNTRQILKHPTLDTIKWENKNQSNQWKKLN